MANPYIVCVYKPGSGFTDDYVTRLQSAVAEHCSQPYNFVCLTNQKIDGVDCRPLLRANKRWWVKLELFRKGLFDGPVVYFDLDTIVIRDITDIVTYPHVFTAGCNWDARCYAGLRTMNSGFMAWNGLEDLSHIDSGISGATDYEYSQSFEKWGDQAWIQNHLGRDFESIDDLFPGRYVSYKLHVRRHRKIPEGASIVAFHGKPRPHEIGWSLS